MNTQTTAPRHAAWLMPEHDDADAFDAYVQRSEQAAGRFAQNADRGNGQVSEIELQTIADTTVRYASDEGVIPNNVELLNRLAVHNPETGDTAYLLQLKVTLPAPWDGSGPEQTLWAMIIGNGELELNDDLATAMQVASVEVGL